MQSDEASHRFKIRDSASYDDVSEAFDRFTERFSRPMADLVLRNAKLRPTDDLLDVGTGSGILARAAAHRLSSGSVTGIDLSRGMLATAEGKAATDGVRVAFRTMDAESLQFDSESFDVVVSLYALRHFPNPERAVAEMHRVLKLGGRITIGVGSKPALLTREGAKAGLHRVGRRIRSLAGRGDYEACRYLANMVEDWLPKTETEEAEWTGDRKEYSSSVTAMLRRVGFENIKADWVGQRSVIESSEEFWELQVTFSSLARKRIGSSDAARVAELKQAFIDECNTHMRRGGRLVYATGATVVAGSRA